MGRGRLRSFVVGLAAVALVSALAPAPYVRAVTTVPQSVAQIESMTTAPHASMEARTPTATATGDEGPTAARAVAGYGALPLSFEANAGQTHASVDFLARGPGYALFLSATRAVLAAGGANERSNERGVATVDDALAADVDLVRTAAPTVVRVELIGAEPNARVSAVDELPGKVNYFVGNDPSRWRTNVATYAKVRYADVYPGIDLVYYGNQRQLEYDVVVAPGADPGRFRLGVESSTALRIDASGDLVIGSGSGEVRLRQPYAFQETEGRRHTVAAAYRMFGDGEVGFELGSYDPALPLVIDPVLVYGLLLGGSLDDIGRAIAVDVGGQAYVAGRTRSSDFPMTTGAYRTALGETLCLPSTTPFVVCGDATSGVGDAFVTKINPQGTAKVFSTYLGGGRFDEATGVAIDSSGNVYLSGGTASFDFPRTANAFSSTYSLGGDAFIAKLDVNGSQLLYSSYLGGSGHDFATAIAADSSGGAVIVGGADTGFPLKNAAQTAFGGPAGAFAADAFVAKFDTTATTGAASLVYSTYLGGSASEQANGVALDGAGNAYVVGETPPTTPQSFPTTTGAAHSTYIGGSSDAFVTKYSSAGAVLYSTFMGGSASDFGSGIAVDASGNAYITGMTTSADAATAGAAQTTNPGTTTVAYVQKLNPAGTQVLWGTLLGGSGGDAGYAIAVDAGGNTYVTGQTSSVNFPTVSPFQGKLSGPLDAFVTKINPAGTAFVYSSYLGGSSNDAGLGIAVDTLGNAYVAGQTLSTDFPGNATGPRGGIDAFVTKVSACTPVFTASSATLCVGTSPRGIAVNQVTSRAYVANHGANTVSVIQLGATLAASTVLGSVAVGNGPFGLAVDPTTNRIYVANQFSDSVTVINGADHTVIATVGVGGEGTGGPIAVAVSTATHRVYVANNTFNGDRIKVIDGDPTHTTTVNTVVKTITIGQGSLHDVAFNNTNNRLYATVGNSVTPTVDALYTFVDEVPLAPLLLASSDRNPSGVAVNEATGQVWISTMSGVTVVTDSGTAQTVAFSVATGAHERIAVNKNSNRGFAPVQGGSSVSIVDGGTRTASTRAVGYLGNGVGVHLSTGFVLVSNFGDGTVTILADGITGVAQCGESVLPNATVELRSGTRLLATTKADAQGVYFLPPLGPGVYAITFIGTDGTICGGTLTVGDGGTTVTPGPTCTNPNRTFYRGQALVRNTATTARICKIGDSSWFKIEGVKPESLLGVTLTGPNGGPLDPDLNLFLYRDIVAEANRSVATKKDVTAHAAGGDFIGGEFIGGDFIGGEFIGGDFIGGEFIGGDFIGGDFIGGDFIGGEFIGGDFIGGEFIGGEFIGGDFIGGDFIGGDFIGGEFIGGEFIGYHTFPETTSLKGLDPKTFADAVRRSLVRISVRKGSAKEGLMHYTWDKGGTFYVQVRGYKGAADPGKAFEVKFLLAESICSPLDTTKPVSTHEIPAGSFGSLILTNSLRFPAADRAQLNTALNTLAALTGGYQADFGADPAAAPGVRDLKAAYAQWDAFPRCSLASNIVSDGVKDYVDRFRAAHPELTQIVFAGGDSVVPFRRENDPAKLAPESMYSPPSSGTTNAGLRTNKVLSDDFYTAGRRVQRGIYAVDLPELPTGRLVETAAEIANMVGAYQQYPSVRATATRPLSAIVTGTQFLDDLAEDEKAQLEAMGVIVNAVPTAHPLIQTGEGRPTDPNAWTSADLLAAFQSDTDLLWLNAHMTQPGRFLAGDGSPLTTSQLLGLTGANPNLLRGKAVFSTSCHSGFNVLDAHNIVGATPGPDSPQFFAQRGATVVGGTGWQYGETVPGVKGYTERIHLNILGRLREGTGPVSIGQALLDAKVRYAQDQKQFDDLTAKAYMEAVLYGVPSFAVDFGTVGRLPSPGDLAPFAYTELTPVTRWPGKDATLDLRTKDLTLDFAGAASATHQLQQRNVSFRKLDGTGYTPTAYFVVADTTTTTDFATQTNPGQPVQARFTVPLRVESPTGTFARGVVFLSGTTQEFSSIGAAPLTPTVATPAAQDRQPMRFFYSANAFPTSLASINYLGPSERLVLTPAQYRSSVAPGIGLLTSGSFITYPSMTVRLYYSPLVGQLVSAGGTSNFQAALAGPPILGSHTATTKGGNVDVEAFLSALPNVGVQDVFVTWTALGTSTWQSVRLGQDSTNGLRWTGSIPIPAGKAGADIRYMIQAVNGYGAVSRYTNFGALFRSDEPLTVIAPKTPTALAFENPPTTAIALRGLDTVARLVDQNTNTGLGGKRLTFWLGRESVTRFTDTNGRAGAHFAVNGRSGAQSIAVTFEEDDVAIGSSATADVAVSKDQPTLTTTLAPTTQKFSNPVDVSATLRDGAARPLTDQLVFFLLRSGTTIAQVASAETDRLGVARARFAIAVAPGTYGVTAVSGGIVDLGSQTVNMENPHYLQATSAPTTLLVAPKNVSVVYTGDTVKDTASAVSLRATLVEEPDGFLANLSGATVTFSLFNTTTNVAGPTVPGTLTVGVGGTGTATATLTAGTLLPGVYRVTVTVGGTYTGSTSAFLAIYAPSTTAFATADGWMIPDPATVKGFNSTERLYFGSVGFRRTSFGLFGAMALVQGTTVFASIQVDYLVVAGKTAVAEGRGSLNGVRGYRYRIQMTEGPVRSVSLRIWDATSSFDAPLYRAERTPLDTAFVIVRP